MEEVISAQQCETQTDSNNRSSKTLALPKLPWRVIEIIFTDYFYALGPDDFLAIREGLGTLIEACCTHVQRSTIFKLLEDIYGPQNITKLVLACEVCERPGVYEWIQKYPHLTRELLVASRGTTPLISALRNQSKKTATFLISVSPQACTLQSDTGYTPLMAAAEHNNCVALSELLEKGVALNAIDHYGYTALHRAVERGHYESTKVLLEAQANPDARTTKDGFTPLYIALLIKNEPLVSLLLDYKANPNIKTNESMTPLMHVLYMYYQINKEAQEGYEKHLATLEAILRHLLQSKAIKVNKPGLFGVSPLGKALECELRDDIIQAFTDKGAQLSSKERCRAKKTEKRTLNSKK